METFQLEKDIHVFCVTAKSFPGGVMAAFDTLGAMLPKGDQRAFFGISRPDEKGAIIYKAAVEEQYEGEGKEHGCEPFLIKKGTYLAEALHNWRDQTALFQIAFNKLLQDKRMDMNFPCLEWYKSDDEVMCMIRLDDGKINASGENNLQ
jgi:hypothetical protein